MKPWFKITNVLVALLSVIGYGAFVFAAQLSNGTVPPPGGYLAGDSILDPGCAPGATDCFKNVFSGWNLGGNAGTDSNTDFIGTTDAQDFVVQTNSTEAARFFTNGDIRLNAYSSTRDDANVLGYSVGSTIMQTFLTSPNDVVFSGTYTGSSIETYTVVVGGDEFTLGATNNQTNLGSPNDVVFSGVYTGVGSALYSVSIGPGGTTFSWSDGQGASGSGILISPGTYALSNGISVTFGSPSYIFKEAWSAPVTLTEFFSWTDGHGGFGNDIPVGVGVVLSEGVKVTFGSSGYATGETWTMTTVSGQTLTPPTNLLYTDSMGTIRSVQVDDLVDGTNGLSKYNGYGIGLGGTLTQDTNIDLANYTLNLRNSGYDYGFLATSDLGVVTGFPSSWTNFVGVSSSDTILNGIVSNLLEQDSNTNLSFSGGSSPQFLLRSKYINNKSYISSFEFADGILLRSEDSTQPTQYSSDIVLNLGDLYMSARNSFHINTPNVLSGTATNGQALVLTDASTGAVEFQSIGASSNWLLTGNSGTNSSTDFIGTADSQDFIIKANNIELARFGTGSSVVIGPSNTLGNIDNNFIFGSQNTIDSTLYANNTVAIGASNLNIGGRGITIGTQLVSNSSYEVVLGAYNTTYTAASTSSTMWGSGDRLFNIGDGYLTRSDAFTILKNGQTGVGIDNFEANTNGNIFQVGDGTTAIIGYVDSLTGNWVAVSDARTKKNISDITYGLNQVLALRPVQYDFIRNNEHAIGFIAQEVQPIIPDVVFGDDRQYGIAYQTLVPVLVKAIQELNVKVDVLATNTDYSSLISWFASKTNGITRIFTKELCLTDGVQEECITMDQLRVIKQSLGVISSSTIEAQSEQSQISEPTLESPDSTPDTEVTTSPTSELDAVLETNTTEDTTASLEPQESDVPLVTE